MKEAYFYEKKENNNVLCTLCPHYCQIAEGGYGKCRVRKNSGGKLYALNYGHLTVCALDPIEKKPLYHFCSGRPILSIGSFGCNFDCDFCQNWSIAKGDPRTTEIDLEKLLEKVMSIPDNIGLAYTYNEPTVYYEFMLDMAKGVQEAGYKNVMVSNGFINPEPLEVLLPYIDAFNIDLKAFNDDFYQSICGGDRLPVMTTIERIAKDKHIEVTLLLIEGLNTNLLELETLFQWLASVDKSIPLHISRYSPAYKMMKPPTPIESMKVAKVLADRYLDHVHLGNMPLVY